MSKNNDGRSFDQVEISKGLLGSFLFVFIWMMQKIQMSLGSLWFIIVKILLWFFKNHDLSDDSITFIVDESRKVHKLLWPLLRWAMEFNEQITGMIKPINAYPRLISWNGRVPLYGYCTGENLGTVQRLGAVRDNGRRAADLVFLNIQMPTGHFNIIRKFKVDKDQKLYLECAWTSGKYAGCTFLSGVCPLSIEELKELANRNIGPDYYYFPPRWICFLIEVIISVGAIVTVVASMVNIYSTFDTSKLEVVQTKVTQAITSISHIQELVENQGRRFDILSQDLEKLNIKIERIFPRENGEKSSILRK